MESARQSTDRNRSWFSNRRATGPANGNRPVNRARTPYRSGLGQASGRSTLGQSGGWPISTENVRVGGDNVGNADRRMRQAGEELFHDAVRHQHPGRRMRIPRSPRASAPRFDLVPDSQFSASLDETAEEQTLLPRPYMPSPPYSFSEHAGSSRPGRRRRQGSPELTSAEPTPDFAPARGTHHEHRSSRMTSQPTLRRVGRLSPRQEPHLSIYAGLGDRRRSLSISSSRSSSSPVTEGLHEVEQYTWDPLGTTMQPDDHLPSTESSFTSATASQSTQHSRPPSRRPSRTYTSTSNNDTARELSRPSRPDSLRSFVVSAEDFMRMELDILNPQYDCLSWANRVSMGRLISVIQHSRHHRNQGSQDNQAPQSDWEQHRRSYENLMLCYHYHTLKMIEQESHGSSTPPIHTRADDADERAPYNRPTLDSSTQEDNDAANGEGRRGATDRREELQEGDHDPISYRLRVSDSNARFIAQEYDPDAWRHDWYPAPYRSVHGYLRTANSGVSNVPAFDTTSPEGGYFLSAPVTSPSSLHQARNANGLRTAIPDPSAATATTTTNTGPERPCPPSQFIQPHGLRRQHHSGPPGPHSSIFTSSSHSVPTNSYSNNLNEPPSSAGPHSEWTGFQRFMERMARRQDIPDEWWASIGLARTIRENQDLDQAEASIAEAEVGAGAGAGAEAGVRTGNESGPDTVCG